MDEERGKKRSCKEAALPERSAEGQQKREAILVDSSGAPASLEPAESGQGQQQTEAIVVDSSGAPAILAPAGPAAEQQQPEANVVDSSGAPASLGPPEETESHSKAAKSVDEAAQEESRASFSALV